ncbi:hypothetical protein M404DRAFT_999447 [Pisolithus tinctorius Marx 270]|uniref:Uncharacterized protein n=1 Tax=Pisolithus tinctorius Marx 270 TaxID=870435 RepID=A0A0C3JAY6_PISTI|nr:hypothetical protein M404DRAFT_999447 [Pisolithus tinctorius Marx 270]
MKTLKRSMKHVGDKIGQDTLAYDLSTWFPFGVSGVMTDGGGCMLTCSLPPCWTGVHSFK